MTEPTLEEAQEALHILAGQCGRPKIRKENSDIIKKHLMNCTPQETYQALDRGVPPLKNHGKRKPPSASHLDTDQAGAAEILLLEARVRALEAHGDQALAEPDLRNGYTVETTISFLNRQINHLKQMNQPNTQDTTESAQKQPQGGASPVEKQPPGGGEEEEIDGIESTLELLVEIRQARTVIQSQLVEVKKRAKVKVQKLNVAESHLLDAYETHDRQLTLFDLPPVSEEVRAILDMPQI